MSALPAALILVGSCVDATLPHDRIPGSDDISLVRGNHQMSFGVNLAHWRTNQYAATRATGIYSFDGNATGLGMADFLTGRLSIACSTARRPRGRAEGLRRPLRFRCLARYVEADS